MTAVDGNVDAAAWANLGELAAETGIGVHDFIWLVRENPVIAEASRVRVIRKGRRWANAYVRRDAFHAFLERVAVKPREIAESDPRRPAPDVLHRRDRGSSEKSS
jgi:hypothetical protein